MKYTLFTSALLVALIFSGCKSKVTEIKIKPKTVTIKGALGKYFEVVDKEYLVKPWRTLKTPFEIVVEVRRLDNNFENELAWPSNYDVKSFQRSDEGIDYYAGFGIEFMDDNGPVSISHPEKPEILAGTADDTETVIRLNSGETGYLHFITYNLEALKSFQITSAFEKKIK